MISKKVIDDFLAQELTDWDWVKKMPIDEIRNNSKGIDDTFSFYEENRPLLLKNQLECFFIAQFNYSFLYFTSMGGGKTRLAIELIRYRKHRKECKKALVIVKHVVHCTIWEEQFAKYSELSFISLKGGTNVISDLIGKNLDKDVFIISYPSLTALLSPFIESEDGKKREIDERYLKAFTSLFDMCVCDELHAVRKRETKIYEILSYLMPLTRFKYGLTGTPLDKNPEDLWPMFYFMDEGETLGRNITFYREAFFTMKKMPWKQYVYKIKKELIPTLNKRLKHKSIRHGEDELCDLPETSIIDIPIKLSHSARLYYSRYVEKARNARKDGVSPGNVFVALRRITSGYAVLDCSTTEDTDKVDIIFDENPKLEVLMSYINDLEGAKTLVFNEYRKTGDIITERLEHEKIKYRRIYGGTRNQGEELKGFIKDKHCQVLLLNNEIGSSGLDGLQHVCNYMLFYETPTQVINYTQALKRLSRTGQTKKVFVYRLLAHNTVDDSIVEMLELGEDIFKAVVDNLALLTREQV